MRGGGKNAGAGICQLCGFQDLGNLTCACECVVAPIRVWGRKGRLVTECC